MRMSGPQVDEAKRQQKTAYAHMPITDIYAGTLRFWGLQVEEAKREREGRPWPEAEQAAFKAQIADRCGCSKRLNRLPRL